MPHLQSPSRANIRSLSLTLRIPIRISRDLHLLAQRPNIHSLPTINVLHLSEELGRRLRGVHVGCDVGVVGCTLLEDAHAVIV